MRAADGQPQAQAVLLGGVERLENAFRVRRQATAGVRDGNPHRAIAVRRRHVQLAARGRIGRHRVAGIEDQVEQHLLELDVVAPNLRHVRGQAAVDRDAVPDETIARELEHFFDDAIHG